MFLIKIEGPERVTAYGIISIKYQFEVKNFFKQVMLLTKLQQSLQPIK